MFRRLAFFLFVFISIAFEIFAEDGHFLKPNQELNQRKNVDRPLLMVHYMPWFQAKPIRDYWGWHWTMNHFNPDNMDATGRREIASHYYPLTGPYDSNDYDLLEYQVLLMKLSGIDGIIADWYGMEDFWDYGLINESTHNIFQYAKNAGLSFSVCYEDQTIGHMVDNDHFNESKAVPHAQEVMQYLEESWFSDDYYIKLEARPVLLTFGPQYFYNSSDWENVFSVLDTTPQFFTLNNQLYPVATGAFPWPPMWSSVDGVLTEDALYEYLDRFYQQSFNWDYLVAGAFPGFHDIYYEAGLEFSHGYLNANNGETFSSTLQIALDNDPDIVQIITWNDYGEGTTIEPTIEYGYRYLELIQDIRRTSIDSTFPFESEDLLIPLQIFSLRKMYEDDPSINALLDEAFDLIVLCELDSAVAILGSISSFTNILSDNEDIPNEYSLKQNCPNPFNAITTIDYQLPELSGINISIYNVAGQLVTVLLNEHKNAGYHSVVWNASDISSGLYFYRITAGGYSAVRKCLMLK